MIAKDKKLHAAAGFGIGGVAAILLQAPAAAIVFALIAGLAKEAYDLWQNWKARKALLPEPHSVELYDLIYTVLGGVVAVLAVSVILQFT